MLITPTAFVKSAESSCTTIFTEDLIASPKFGRECTALKLTTFLLVLTSQSSNRLVCPESQHHSGELRMGWHKNSGPHKCSLHLQVYVFGG